MGRISNNGLWAALVLGAAGCSASNVPSVPDNSGNPNPRPPAGTRTPYDLAHGCFRLLADGAYVTRQAPLSDAGLVAFTTTDGTADNAERFYLQPAGLGRYVFYTADRKFMTGAGAVVTALDAPSDTADWTVELSGKDAFTATTADAALARDANTGALTQVGTAAQLTFERSEGCSTYPEMPLAIGETYQGRGKDVIGFAEVHAHMAMGSDMSDGSGDRGPSAGGVMYGHAANRFGVQEALKDCVTMHGVEGTASPEGPVLDTDPGQTHATEGWPTFIDWPARDSLLHQQMYYRWVERTYRAGLRLMVAHGTNIEALCEIAKYTVGDKNADCTDMGVGIKQVQYLHDIEKYVDAQEGGPGKGWFRIARDPTHAREIIADGKLAVVPGLEFSNIFHCNVTYTPDGGEVAGCDEAMIDEEIEMAWDEGVRQVFAFHDVDSALGGTGIFSSVLNYVGFYGTKGFWTTYTCPDVPYFYGAGAEMESAPLTGFNDPITQALIENTQGQTPIYPPGKQCNARGLTPLGQYALEKMMKKGFVLDIDHAELSIKQDMLDMGAKTDPTYPHVSGHGGHGGISMTQARQILEQGGIIFPNMINGREYKEFVDKIEPIWPADRPLAVGYGADQNGLANQPGPRPAPFTAVTYPFRLFEGEGWEASKFKAAGIDPIQVELLQIPESGKSWNPDEVGVAHYGLVPDVIEQIRLESGGDTKYTSALYNSAEAYLRLWKRTIEASAYAQGLPDGEPTAE